MHNLEKIYLYFRSFINKMIYIFQILWLLTYDDDNYTLLRTLEKCNIMFSNLWLPQMLNIFVETNELAIKRIILKVICYIRFKQSNSKSMFKINYYAVLF